MAKLKVPPNPPSSDCFLCSLLRSRCIAPTASLQRACDPRCRLARSDWLELTALKETERAMNCGAAHEHRELAEEYIRRPRFSAGNTAGSNELPRPAHDGTSASLDAQLALSSAELVQQQFDLCRSLSRGSARNTQSRSRRLAALDSERIVDNRCNVVLTTAQCAMGAMVDPPQEDAWRLHYPRTSRRAATKSSRP